MTKLTAIYAQRITELETRLEFQDETVAKLNDALVVQQQKYFELEKKLTLLIARLQENNFELMDAQDEPPPPHY